MLVAILLLSVSGCGAEHQPAPSPEGVSIYVIARGWHTDLGLPAQEISGPLSALKQIFPGAEFLTFGFGERQFLLARRATLGGMLSALFPSRSAMLITALRTPPSTAFGKDTVVALRVTPGNLARLEATLWQEFEILPNGQPRLLGDGPYPGSLFFAAQRTYDALNTCNTWTARMLRAAGLPVRPAGVLFAGQVMGIARQIAADQAQTATP